MAQVAQTVEMAGARPSRVQRVRIFYLLAHLHERRERLLSEILRPHNLTLVQWRILYALGKLSNRTMNEVADFLVLDRTSLTRAVDKLVERGLMLRAEVAHDRRLTELSLTAAGRTLREDLLEQNIEMCERLVADLDQESLDDASGVLTHVLERLVGHRAGVRRIAELV